ncbi:phosphate-regulating neutral endopeptidase PHEX [Hemitrygon akajei]|uniref:phosphate-regulating neutral endopeptidase PHEX n=1 Tax=Hemitrygon akajei TaxID=2704970 RepID=UPI003BF96523
MQMEVLENARPTMGRHRNKWLKVALFISVAVAVALGIVLILAARRVIRLHSEEYCTTAECAEAAVTIFNKINWSADPCDNFYNFACGRWQKETPIPEDYPSYGIYDWVEQNVYIMLRELLENPIDTEKDIESEQDAKRLYQSCMNETAIELEDSRPLLHFLKHPHLRWPVLEASNGPDGTWKEEEFDLLEALAILRGRFARNVFINFRVTLDEKSSSERILTLGQASLLMNVRENYMANSLRAKSIRHALLQLMIDVPILLGANTTIAKDDMEAAMEFETKLAEIVFAEKNRTSEAIHTKLSILDLQSTIPQFDWLRYIRTVIDFEEHPHLIHMNMSEEVIVDSVQYFKDLFRLLETVENRTVANYIVWRVVYSRLGNLSHRFFNRFSEYIKVITGMKSLSPRWDTCTSFVEAVMPYAVGRMFVKAHFQENKKKLTEDLVAGIRWAFLDIVEKENDWMDAETKDKAKEKAKAILAKIGYPTFILNDDAINNKYRNVTISATDYFGNLLSFLRFYAQLDFRDLRRRMTKTEWFTHPTTVNAFYVWSRNQIQFPAGELQKPFFWGEEYPLSVSYGAIGTIIGHEFSHAFDSHGRKYDIGGNLHQWWSNDSISNFEAKANCLVRQYSNYYWTPARLKVNGQQTLAENIADNVAVRLAFKAYRKWVQEEKGGREEALLPGLKLNHNQLFFLSHAQVRCSNHNPEAARNRILTGVHSPPEIRVIGAIANSEEFSKAYNCPSTSPMNRGANSCRVW